MIYLLDTDHVSLDQRGNEWIKARISQADPEQVAISMITVEEQVRGWLAAVRTAKSSVARTTAYRRLRLAIKYFAASTLVDYDEDADLIFDNLRRQGIRIGTQDLRIAAIALHHDATLVTRNSRDFNLVPDLKIVDWSLPH